MAEFVAESGEENPWRLKFADLQDESIDSQCEFFCARYAFSLGDNIAEVEDLCVSFKAACQADTSGTEKTLSPAGLSNLLQTRGTTRTALQRKQELADVDLDKNGQISFSEYLLLHYKVMILTEYYKRKEMEPDVDLSNDGIGLVGVGPKLLEELFSVPQGLDKNLDDMMREFSVEHAKRKAKKEQLQATVDAGGVKGKAAASQLAQIKAQDTTEWNAVQARIAAAMKKARAKSKAQLKEIRDRRAGEKDTKRAEGQAAVQDKQKNFGGGVRKSLSNMRASLSKKFSSAAN
jgi:hypothetical protein